ncbi:MAG: hypothetical protein KBA86_02815 [Bacteroidales bacterium]|nr:hypothetical protein [Bacteroidales bacterium]
MKQKIIYILLLCCPLLTIAQQSNEYLLWAADAAKQKDFQSATYFYQEYIKQGYPLDPKVYFLYAHALHKSYQYLDAELMYEKGLKIDTLKAFPEGLFELAMVKKNLSKYKEAIELLQKYQLLKTSDTLISSKRLRSEIDICQKATFILSDTLPLYIEQFNTIINTSFSEFNPMQLGDTALYFSTLRPITTNSSTHIIEDFYISKIYATKYEINGFSEPKPISKKINHPKYDNANFCFNQDKTKLYFSRKQPNQKTKIWVSELVREKWQKPKLLPSVINHPDANNTQPFLVTLDENNEILYFVSDRPKGIGEMDIWFAVITKDHFGEAINAGSNINTLGNEITPFYYTPTQTLYFSSDWHPGLGGYDIFKSKGAMSNWSDPELMGYPFNSPANDIYFTINEVDSDGFFTSNRKSSYDITQATCCNDIFLYEWKPVIQNIQIDTIPVKDTMDIPLLLTKILPINLYFHNDEPDPKTTAVTTNKNYKNTLDEYFSLQELYREEYSKGLENKEKEEAIATIDAFFKDYVQKGYELLEMFSSLLMNDLQRGKSINITVSGFASPLFSDEYNINLSLRRIESLKNYLREYNNGVFIPYMDSTKSNQLHIINAPKGKTMANPYVSDNPNDKRNSIYSIAAAFERRVQIFGYDEDTIIKTLFLSVPDSLLTFISTPGVTDYIKYIEIKNLGKDTIYLKDIQTNSKMFQVSMEKNVLKSNENTYLKVTFTERAFRFSPLLQITIKASKDSEHKDIIINCLLEK